MLLIFLINYKKRLDYRIRVTHNFTHNLTHNLRYSNCMLSQTSIDSPKLDMEIDAHDLEMKDDIHFEDNIEQKVKLLDEMKVPLQFSVPIL